MLEKDVPLAKGVKNVKGSGHLKRTAAERNDVHEKINLPLTAKSYHQGN